MYSIFNSKTKSNKYLEEGEPPPKKVVSEKDILIKKLSENQLKTTTTLTEESRKQKEFISSESFSDITSYVSGKKDLNEFQTKVANAIEENSLKRKGLTDRDIELYKEYKLLGPHFWDKYKSVSKDALDEHIREIEKTVIELENSKDCDPDSTLQSFSQASESRSNNLNSNSQNVSALLKSSCIKKQRNEDLPNPMDEMPSYEKEIMSDIIEFSSCDVEKIRKKARSLGNQIKNLDNVETAPITYECRQKNVKNISIQRPTLWDMKESPQNLQRKVEIIDKDKVYSCKPQNWYTIKEGEIIKLDQSNTISTEVVANEQNLVEKAKLSIEEIRQIPKFANYEPGDPTKVLFVKNLGKTTSENTLKSILKPLDRQCYCVKMMNGKMRGQAFIEFEDNEEASNALEILNGVVSGGKPIIATFGKKKII